MWKLPAAEVFSAGRGAAHEYVDARPINRSIAGKPA
jgi:hypothetical protein